jgi:hypothetical protein
MNNDEKIKKALVSLRPFIENKARMFSKKYDFLDSSAFEDVGYNEIYQIVENLRCSNGNLNFILSATRHNIERAMGRFAKRQKSKQSRLLELYQSNIYSICQPHLSLDRLKMLEEIKKFDIRLGLLFEKVVILGQPFDKSGDKSYYYRGLKKFSSEKGNRLTSLYGCLDEGFFMLYGNS